jgi:hypothetical protein
MIVMHGGTRAQRLQGAVFDLCRDQHGSRYVQTRLDSASKEEVGALPYPNRDCSHRAHCCQHSRCVPAPDARQEGLAACAVRCARMAPASACLLSGAHALCTCAAVLRVGLRPSPLTRRRQVDWLFAEVGGREQLSALAQDPFGNFTLQKLLECGSQPLREALAAAVAGDVEAHTRHMYGCRVLQKLLEARALLRDAPAVVG